MKRNKILTLMAAALLAAVFSSCADMMWDVGTGISTGPDYYGPYYYGYNNSIWNNAINGFYGPIWTSPAPPPPYRPAPGPAIR
ncbi:MAG: hypothetical protein K2H03_04595, partial [Muribaculaceae bacterium]|nr:hypothetical protein [Muribaculaceae bacterium]